MDQRSIKITSNLQEDNCLIELIDTYGIKNWSIIANKINDIYVKKRSGKQCRERFEFIILLLIFKF